VPPQRGVMAAPAQQLLVRALLDDAALIEHDQTVIRAMVDSRCATAITVLRAIKKPR
jgi:hypothetical protein